MTALESTIQVLGMRPGSLSPPVVQGYMRAPFVCMTLLSFSHLISRLWGRDLSLSRRNGPCTTSQGDSRRNVVS